MRQVEADFVLLDVQLPGADGLECLAALAKHYLQVKVAMLSAVEDQQVIESAFRRGASGYILKSVNPYDLPGAIRQIVEKTVIHLPVAGHNGARRQPCREACRRKRSRCWQSSPTGTRTADRS